MQLKKLVEQLVDIPFEVKNVDNELEMIKYDTLIKYMSEHGFAVTKESQLSATITHGSIRVGDKPLCFTIATERAMDYADSVAHMIRRLHEHTGKNQLQIVIDLLELQD